MDNHYKGLIWTNHALDRLRQRGISQGDAWATWNRPDKSRKGTAPGSWVYFRTFGNQRIEVVAKKNEKKEWLILSVWSKQVNIYQRSRDNSNFWKSLISLIFGKTA